MERIINLSEASAISASDYVLIDSPTQGTRKFLAANLSQGGGGGTTYTDLFDVQESAQLLDASTVNRTYTITQDGVYLVGLVCERRYSASAGIDAAITGDYTTLYSYSNYAPFCVKVIEADANTTITYSATLDTGGRAKCFCIKINLDITSVTQLYSQYIADDGYINYDPSSLTVSGQKALVLQIANFDGNSGEITYRVPQGVLVSNVSLFYPNNMGATIDYGDSHGNINIFAIDSLANVTSTYTRGGSWGSVGLIILDLI